MREIRNLFEGFVIRVLWVMYATRLRATPGLCPPACSEGHTYKWPCRARIQRAVYSRIGSQWDDPVRIGSITNVHTESDGIRIEGRIDAPGPVAQTIRDMLTDNDFQNYSFQKPFVPEEDWERDLERNEYAQLVEAKTLLPESLLPKSFIDLIPQEKFNEILDAEWERVEFCNEKMKPYSGTIVICMKPKGHDGLHGWGEI